MLSLHVYTCTCTYRIYRFSPIILCCSGDVYMYNQKSCVCRLHTVSRSSVCTSPTIAYYVWLSLRAFGLFPVVGLVHFLKLEDNVLYFTSPSGCMSPSFHFLLLSPSPLPFSASLPSLSFPLSLPSPPSLLLSLSLATHHSTL